MEQLLTARERDALALVLGRATNRLIAEKLGCSLKTAEFHVSNILRKTGAASRAELMRTLATPDGPPSSRRVGRRAVAQSDPRAGRADPLGSSDEDRARAVQHELTKRELSVLELLRAGSSNKDIAQALGCSVRTAEYHVANVLRKTNVSRRLSLVGAHASELPMPRRLGSPARQVRRFGEALASTAAERTFVREQRSAAKTGPEPEIGGRARR